jgi:hypothetical protein
MPGGTTRATRGAFHCSGAECELVEMMVLGSNAALWYDPAYCLGRDPRRCELSIVIETAEWPADSSWRPEQAAYL